MVKRESDKKKESDGHEHVYNAWLEFSKDVGDRMKNITQEGAREYQDMQRTWTEFAQKMTEQMASFSPDDEESYEDMQKMWTQYSGKLGEMFIEAMNGDNGPYSDLHKVWKEYSESMSEHLLTLMNENLRNQHDLYELWMDTFGIKDKVTGNDLSGVYDNMGHMWHEMWKQSSELWTFPQEGSPDWNQKYKDLNDMWIKNYSKMVMDMIRSPNFARMDGEILDGNLELKKFNDKLVDQYREIMGLPTKENMDDIYYKLHELDRKLSSITRVLENQTTSDRKK
jgi:hypothetical protein